MAFTLRTTGNYGIVGYRSVGNFGAPSIRDVWNTLDMHDNYIINVKDPITPQGAATKQYVDDRAAGLDPKASCTYATVSNIANFTVKATVEAALDPVSAVAPVLVDENRVLVKNQTNATENGIYWWQDSSASLVRAPDQDGTPGNEVSGGNYTFVEAGDTLAQSGWIVEGKGVLVIGVDNIRWTLFSARPSYTVLGSGAAPIRDITNGQTFNFKSFVGGTDISVTQSSTEVLISSTATATTLDSLGGTSLVPSPNVGPALDIKGLTAGTDISISSSATALTINNTRAIDSVSSAGGTSLVSSGTAPNFVLKGLTAGTGISLTPGVNDISIAVSAVTPNIIKTTYEVAAADGIAVTAGVLTAVPINTTSYSSGGLTRAGSGIVINATGVYTMSGTCSVDDEPGRMQILIYLNGGLVAIQNSRDQLTGSGSEVVIFHTGSFTAGDILELFLITTSDCRIGTDFAGGNNGYASFTVQQL